MTKKDRLVNSGNFVDTIFMKTKIIRNRQLQSKQIAVIALAVGACLAGSLVSLAGSVVFSIATAVIIGSGCLVYFLFLSKPASSDISIAQTEEAIAIEVEKIPTDRIDALTGLANENGLMAWFAERGAKLASDNKGIIVLSAELADFELVEKTRGKAIADAVLLEVAKRVSSCTGEDGIAARTSGDEFAAVATVVPMHSNELAAEQAGKLAELLQRPVELPTGVIWIGGYVGVAVGSPLDGALVLARAREALKKAKRLGRGHYVLDTSQNQE